MKKVEMTRKRKIGVIIALAATVAIAIACALAIPSCNRENGTGGGTGIGSVAAKVGNETNGVTAKDTPENDEGAATFGNAEASASEGVGHATNPVGSSTNPSGGNAGSSSNGSTASPSDDSPSKRWVTDYKQVWVEDSAAWDEQVPIYNQREISVCNICGAAITGSETAHAKQHMLAGEGSGHHTEVISEIIGHETVHHDAIGHWETIEDGGHWD